MVLDIRALESHSLLMKKNISLLVLVMFAVVSATFSQKKAATDAVVSEYTFEFFEGPFETALKNAAKKKQLIFVDAYTSWCGPCKMMNRSTFKDQAAGEFFNKNVISMKIDMEKGEGPVFAQKYAVSAYPTLLFVNGKGEVVHKVLGYRDGSSLVEEAKKAIALSK